MLRCISSKILFPFPVLTPSGLHLALIEAIISRGESPIEKHDFKEKFSLSDISSNIPLPGLRYLFFTEGKVGQYKIALNDPNGANRDFVLAFKPLQKENAQAAFFTQQFENADRYGLAMLMPPGDYFTQTQRLPREMVFVVDTSGSMHGQSIEQAKKALFFALSLLESDDSFNIIGFDNNVTAMSDRPLIASDFNLRRAERFIYSLEADGGTEIQGALDAVLDGSTPSGVFNRRQCK